MIQHSLAQSAKIAQQFSTSADQLAKVQDCVDCLVHCIQQGGKILSCGNGGSMCDAMHFAEELSGRFRKDRKALPAIALADSAHLSCVANDYGYDQVFSRFVEALGQTGDVLLLLSTSGNSPNILKALEQAKHLNVKTLALLGQDGGKAKALADISIIIPAFQSDRIQEIHIQILHVLVEGIEHQLELSE